jgi:squalene synthase HpnC
VLASTRALAQRHAENFPVLSMFLPRRLRQDFANVYAFCRAADDLADEGEDPAQRRALLAAWRAELRQCFAGVPSHPYFVALQSTVRRHELAIEPFEHLLDAFDQDQEVTRYETWDQLLAYCRGSANPVGRIVLALCGQLDEERAALSDQTCTALQLVNLWQDVRRDILERDRIYVPRAIAASHGLDLEALAAAVRADAAQDRHAPALAALQGAARATIADLCARTAPLFRRGRELWPLLAPSVRPAIALFTRGGEVILRKIERLGFDTAITRPTLSRLDKVRLAGRALWLKVSTKA